jgi:hypothetical protein
MRRDTFDYKALLTEMRIKQAMKLGEQWYERYDKLCVYMRRPDIDERKRRKAFELALIMAERVSRVINYLQIVKSSYLDPLPMVKGGTG